MSTENIRLLTGEQILVAFGQWLAERLDERGWSQGELARRTGYSPGVVSTWVNGKRTPAKRSIAALASALDIPDEVVLEVAGYAEESGTGMSTSDARQIMTEAERAAREMRKMIDEITAQVRADAAAEGLEIEDPELRVYFANFHRLTPDMQLFVKEQIREAFEDIVEIRRREGPPPREQKSN